MPQFRPRLPVRTEPEAPASGRRPSRPFLHMPNIAVPSWSDIESSARELLSGPVAATGLMP